MTAATHKQPLNGASTSQVPATKWCYIPALPGGNDPIFLWPSTANMFTYIDIQCNDCSQHRVNETFATS